MYLQYIKLNNEKVNLGSFRFDSVKCNIYTKFWE